MNYNDYDLFFYHMGIDSDGDYSDGDYDSSRGLRIKDLALALPDLDALKVLPEVGIKYTVHIVCSLFD
jgi:hypothetical protein